MNSEVIKNQIRFNHCVYNLEIADLIIPFLHYNKK